MDLKKVLDQTVREFKREVNKKVLKVPEIEQKVLDATSNEPWGPHGSHMADIAHATRNYHDYQMIMMILWKRINDTGRNWRHVYKSLTILEYLVAHGSERVIDELKEHAYQISTLSEFQYIDSSGRDQGLNVRRKSQALVALVNDKERIREVRQKAVSSRDKYRGVSSTGGMYRPSSYHSTDGSYGGDRYDDDSYSSNYRYGGRDDDRYRDKDADRYRDEERYGRDWDRSGRDGDRYRDDYYDNEENRYSSRRGDDRQGEKSGSYERDRDRSFDDDDRQSSRSGGRGDDYEHDDRRGERRPVGARMPAPPSYEEALGNSESAFASGENQRDGGGLAAAVARASKANNLGQNINAESANAVRAPAECADSIDEFDPRSAAAPSGGSQGDDFFGQAESFSAVLALPAPPSIETAMSNASDIFGDSSMSGFAQAIAAPTNTEPLQKTNGNVFGDSPFKADAPSSSAPAVLQPPSFTTNMEVIGAIPSPTVSNAYMAAPVPFDANEFFGDGSFNVATLSNGSSLNGLPGSLQNVPLTNQQQMPAVQQAGTWTTQPPVSHDSLVNLGQPVAMPMGQGNPVHLAAMAPQLSVPSTAGLGQNVSKAHTAKSQQKDKFETKSTVWADTLSKGLIDLNIGGPKTNPLAGIGIDFDLLRTERIKEERASAAKVSTTSMGKAMGSGSGLGMAGAGAIVPPSPPVMMNSMGMAPMMGAGMGVIPMGGNPGIAMRPGMGFAPAPSMGMVMNPMMGMGMGVRGYQNSQQQFSGYR